MYYLTVLLLNWSEVHNALGSGEEGLKESVITDDNNEWFGEPDDDLFDEWLEALDDLVLGEWGKKLASQGPNPLIQPEEVSEAQAIAFSCLIRTLGEPVAVLEHNSRSGELFRSDFMRAASQALQSPIPLSRLVHRPLFGIDSSSYPGWGGINLDEVKSILGSRSMDDMPKIENPDFYGWFNDLWDALIVARDNESDIITIYE